MSKQGKEAFDVSNTSERKDDDDAFGTVGELNGLLGELKSIERKTSRSDLKASLKKQREDITILIQKIKENSNRTAIKKRVRKVVTGDEGKRVRDHIREKRKTPPVIMFIDKIFFTLGVLNLCVTEYMLLLHPEQFGHWFALTIPLMVLLRYFYYKSLNWRYFMLDFCYFAQLPCLLTLVPPGVLPGAYLARGQLLRVSFLYATGPLAAAIPAWGNKLVFHDMDKVVSVYIHFMPMWLLYAQRWFGELVPFFQEGLSPKDFIYAIIGYCFWQMLYFFKTEVVDKEKFAADPSMQSSLRWLSTDKKNGLHKLCLKLMRLAKIMGDEEEFNPNYLKTKVIFMASQMAYTLFTFLPCLLVYRHFAAHTAYCLLISVWALWNGACYYIDVFSTRYQRKLAELEQVKTKVS